jgi:site-specific recombinase XerD
MDFAFFKEHIKKFIENLSVERNLSAHTLRAYASDLEQVELFWARANLKEKDKQLNFNEIIERYIVALFYKKLSKPSLARKLSSIRSFNKYLDGLGFKVTFDIKSPRIDRKLPATFSEQEIDQILDSITDEQLQSSFPQRDRAIMEVLYATGIRSSELSAMKLEDINFLEKTIKIMRKGKKERFVLFNESVHFHSMRSFLQNYAVVKFFKTLNPSKLSGFAASTRSANCLVSSTSKLSFPGSYKDNNFSCSSIFSGSSSAAR